MVNPAPIADEATGSTESNPWPDVCKADLHPDHSVDGKAQKARAQMTLGHDIQEHVIQLLHDQSPLKT
jgi:hypothetical protein